MRSIRFSGGLAQPDDVLLRRPLRGEEAQAGVGVLGGETPRVGEEVELLGVVRHRQVDVPQVGDETVGHRESSLYESGCSGGLADERR